MTDSSKTTSADRAFVIMGIAVASLACALWLVSLALFAQQVTTVGSPPRVASWDGPAEEQNLPGSSFLFEDEAWLLRDGVGRAIVVRVDLARGVAETGWDLSPLGERSARIHGVARRDDGALTLIVEQRGLLAITLTHDRQLESHGTARLDTLVGVIGVTWVGSTLHAALGDGRRVVWRNGHAEILAIDGCPAIESRTRDTWLAAARWSDAGWDVLVWEAPDRWRWTHGGTDAHPDWAATYGGVSLRHEPFDTPVHVGAPELGAPPNPEVRPRDEPGRDLRWIGEGRWENASAAGGFWDWCLPRGARWICVSHEPFEHRTRLFDGEGHDGSASIHGRFSPADPVIVEASAGGFWILDTSNVSEDGRIHYRLNDDLTRADPMSAWERYRRARPRTRDELDVWQATSGPSAVVIADDDLGRSLFFLLATIELPIALFTFPMSLVLFAIGCAVMRVGRRGASIAAMVIFGSQLALALLTLYGFVGLLELL